ncbi:hypothetical protein ACFQJC_12660 [Haloferax namakaokahaiae]|uniref:DUF4333 domain-containing protein n=1 Tax=Haloferax namakaokahaiae TaxID=1748331 RepID=A0ABD5ZGZ7_9EURY
MHSSSSRRAQLSPLSALTAFFVVCAAITGYATVLNDARPTSERNLGETTLSAVESSLEDDTGVVALPDESASVSSCPDGYSCRVVVAAGDHRRVIGATDPVPTDADRATTRVSVRVAPGDVRFGTLRVEVWK